MTLTEIYAPYIIKNYLFMIIVYIYSVVLLSVNIFAFHLHLMSFVYVTHELSTLDSSRGFPIPKGLCLYEEMGRLNAALLRFLSKDDFRVLTAVCILTTIPCVLTHSLSLPDWRSLLD